MQTLSALYVLILQWWYKHQEQCLHGRAVMVLCSLVCFECVHYSSYYLLNKLWLTLTVNDAIEAVHTVDKK